MSFPNLTPAEYERLALIMEEAAEVQQVIGKILRHGFESTHPDGGPTNRRLLEKELGDLQAAIQISTKAGDIDWHEMMHRAALKQVSVYQYMHHNKPPND